MDRILTLKISALILFWFGIIAQSIIVLGSLSELSLDGHLTFLIRYSEKEVFHNAVNFTYLGFGHFVHIVAAYWLAKGTKKGIILALAISIYEIVTFLPPGLNQYLFTYSSIGIRILFGVVIVLIILGRKELERLRFAHWRPWKNPLQDYAG